MADGVAITAGAGTTIATDDAGAAGHVQIVKLAVSADGSATPVPATSKGLAVDVAALPNGVVDTFGKLQVVSSLNDIDVQFFRDVPANLVSITTANGGTASQTTGLMQLATSTAATGEAKAVSLDNVLYRSGGEVYAIVTAAWLDGGAAGCSQRVGLYDTNNGFFVGYEGATFGVTVRTGASDTQTAQASFNVDTLTGAAGSKFTRAGVAEAIDLTKLNLFRIRFGWLGAAPIRFEVASPDGEWVLFHIIRQPNLSATPSIQSVDLPITAHLVKTSGATNFRFNTACWGAGLTYDKVDIVGSNTLGTALNAAANYNTQGVGTLQIRVGTSTTGTLIFEATTDGVNWVTHPYCWLVDAAGGIDQITTAAVTPTSGNTYRMQCTGFRAIRVRTASTLGATVVLHAQGDSKQSMVNVVSAPPISRDLQRISVTSAGLTTATTAYTAGDQVGTIFALTNAARRAGAGGTITGIVLIDAQDIIGAYDVVFFRQSVTLAADNAAFAISDANALHVVGLAQLAGAFDLGNNRIAQQFNLAIPYVCEGSTTLYAALLTRTGHTFFTGGVGSLQLIVYAERN